MIPADPQEAPAFQQALLDWFEAHARDLPWREPRFRKDPYAVLVSEIMLQQTRVETVIPYFLSWMETWPVVHALSCASEEEVLSAWQGLGYYNRARRLHRAAKQVVEEHEGRLPTTTSTLQDLPGVGPYTARAIAALAFGERVVAVDGNVARVWARLSCSEVDITRSQAKRAAREALEPLAPADDAGVFAEALIELGARVCTPAGPSCDACPVATWCEAHGAGKVDEVPAPREAREIPTVPVLALLVQDGEGRVLVRRRPSDGLLGGLWGLPMAEVPEAGRRATRARSLVEAPVDLDEAPVGEVVHTFTHKRWQVHVHRAWVERTPDAPSLTWQAPEDLDALARSTLDRKVERLLTQAEVAPFG
ncbi:MAG: A/G-specific adenine glycosylase [Candidatus Thermoplasmatota archaeon]|nr:A/G-specific adenine glycosylase [Candidatus Thermoplasmatota archaeon]